VKDRVNLQIFKIFIQRNRCVCVCVCVWGHWGSITINLCRSYKKYLQLHRAVLVLRSCCRAQKISDQMEDNLGSPTQIAPNKDFI
jgi:hypothetical protein